MGFFISTMTFKEIRALMAMMGMIAFADKAVAQAPPNDNFANRIALTGTPSK